MGSPIGVPARVPARYGRRAAAAALDLVVVNALLLLTFFVWTRFEPIRGEGVVDLPTLLKVVFVLAVGVYLIASAVSGRTLGMRALGLRILRVDGSESVGLASASVRSAVLLVMAWLCWSVTPFLLLAYAAWMLFNRRGQMLHDQIAATMVVQSVAVGATPDAVAGAEAELATVAPTQAQELLADLSRLRRRALTDLHPTSVPLLILGVLALGGGLAVGIDTASDSFGFLSSGLLYWMFAGPLGLAVTAWWYRRLRLRHGVQPGESTVVVIAILTGCLVLVPVFWTFSALVTAVGFLAVAVTQRSAVLAVASIVLGLAAGAEQHFGAISNGLAHVLPAGPIEQYSGSLTLAVLGSLLVVTALLARRREQLG